MMRIQVGCHALIVAVIYASITGAFIDVVNSGLYSIQGCGANATNVVDALQILWGIITPSLSDSNATHTSPSYNAFFKDIYYAPFVNSILNNIRIGSPVNQLNPFPETKISSPVIACLQDNPDLFDDQNFLGLHPSFQRVAAIDCADPDRSAVWIGGTQAVILCPRIFGKRLQPPRRSCPGVNSVTNMFKSLGLPISATQAYILLHELVHVYLGAVTDQWLIKREAYSLQDCFDIKAIHSRYNPSNYVYYVNSVYHECNKFPVRRADRDRELFTLSSNLTTDMIWPDNSSDVNGTVETAGV